MNERDILKRVTKIASEVLDFETLVLEPSMKASDVEGWDSLSHVQIIVAIERSFGIRFRTGEIAAIRNVGALVDQIEVCLARASHAGTYQPSRIDTT